jgi:ribosomal protein S18 acetylase RimI-like enzyme
MLAIAPFSRLSSDRRREAATLLFAHLSPQDRSARIDQWLAAVTNAELNPDTIFTAWLHDCLVGVQVVEILPGNFAALWAIRSRAGDERRSFEDALLQAAIERLRNGGVKMAQCLLFPEESAAADALRRRGFLRLTTVKHLRAPCKRTEDRGPRTEDRGQRTVAFKTFAECDAGAFQQVLTQSFEGTLDCPELNDLRTADETWAGHRASASDLSRWWTILDNGQPAGVLILADSALPEVWDLAYVGVLPLARRRGIGRAAVEFALTQATEAGKDAVSLMVDERNHPALDLYKRAGFEQMATRDVYLWISDR